MYLVKKTIPSFLLLIGFLCLSLTYSCGQQKSLKEQLQPIKDNFYRINATKQWTKIDTIENEMSAEGGYHCFFYSDNNLEKIISANFGETFQKVCEYYLLNGELSFSYDKYMKYNRPITWDSTMMKEFDDDQVFDINKSEVEELRNYFSENKLIKQIKTVEGNAKHNNAPTVEEGERVLETYKQILLQITE